MLHKCIQKWYWLEQQIQYATPYDVGFIRGLLYLMNRPSTFYPATKIGFGVV